MEDDILTILNEIGRDVENEEVLDRLEILRSIYNYTSSSIVSMLFNYLDNEKVTNQIITMKLVEQFENQKLLNAKDKVISTLVSKSQRHIDKEIEKFDKPDLSFLGQYLPDNDFENINLSTPLNDDFDKCDVDVVMEEFSENVDDDFTELDWPIKICNQIKSDFKIMNQRTFEIVEVVEKQGHSVIERQLKLYNSAQTNDENLIKFTDLDQVGVSHPDEVYVTGRISIDHTQIVPNNNQLASHNEEDEFVALGNLSNHYMKLSNENIAIQGFSDVRMALEPLVLDQTESYSFFPGQNVILKGKNPSKSGFIVSSVLPACMKPTIPINEDDVLGNLNLVIACGPFTDSMSDDMAPLTDLIKKITSDRCHVLIVIGPIVDINNVATENSDKLFDEIHEERLALIANACIALNTQLIFVPSPDDVAAMPVYPQPSFNVPISVPELANELIHFAPNPALVKIGPYIFGFNSVDILQHMGKQEISKGTTEGRIKRLYSHILGEGNFYPLKPSNPDVDIDWVQWGSQCNFGLVSPHCLVSPSVLNVTKETTGHVLCVNPGFVKKASQRSTFCRLTIRKPKHAASPTSIGGRTECRIINL